MKRIRASDSNGDGRINSQPNSPALTVVRHGKPTQHYDMNEQSYQLLEPAYASRAAQKQLDVDVRL